jgi:hypothetical protein
VGTRAAGIGGSAGCCNHVCYPTKYSFLDYFMFQLYNNSFSKHNNIMVRIYCSLNSNAALSSSRLLSPLKQSVHDTMRAFVSSLEKVLVPYLYL